MPLVTVYILSYNQEKYLKQRIDSVLQQSFKDFQIVIYDDCSADNSKEIIEAYKGNDKIIEIIYHTKNSGSGYRQWQRAIEDCTTKYLWIAEGDDFAEPDFLHKTVAFLEHFNEACLVETNSSYIVDGKLSGYSSVNKNRTFFKKKWNKDFLIEGTDLFCNYLCYGNCIENVSAVLFRTKNLKQLDAVVSEYKYLGDWRLYIELSKNYKFGYLQEVLSNFRKHPGSVTASGNGSPVALRETDRIRSDFVRQFEVLGLTGSVTFRKWRFSKKFWPWVNAIVRGDYLKARQMAKEISVRNLLLYKPSAFYLLGATYNRLFFFIAQKWLTRKK
ncbi:MAG: glycosyltransferase family 2 protein [Niabella sp.]